MAPLIVTLLVRYGTGTEPYVTGMVRYGTGTERFR
jgi:hypothetical protein